MAATKNKNVVTSHLPQELYAGLNREATANGFTMSRVVAQACELYLMTGGNIAYMELKLNELKARNKP